MKKFLSLSAKLLVVLLIIGACAYAAITNKWFKSSTDSPIQLDKVSRTDLIQRVTIAGTIVPRRRTIIMAPYNGYIRKLFVKVGDSVKQGDPIVTVTPSLQGGDAAFPLRSPLSGTVVQLERNEGEYVKENDNKEFIARIDDLSELYVQAQAPEIDWNKLHPEQVATIKAAAVNDRSYRAVTRQLSLAAREKESWGKSQVEFPVKLQILDADKRLTPGMSVVIEIVVERKDKVLTLRHEYLHKEGDHYFVVLKDGRRRKVETGMQNEEAFEIRSGLNEGEEVRQADFLDHFEKS